MKPTLVSIDDRQVIELNDTDTFIGRSSENDIVLRSDLSLSRRHAVISQVEGVYYLRDLASSNGTALNGAVITGLNALNPNDEIFLGRTRFLYCPTDERLDAAVTYSSEANTVVISENCVPQSVFGKFVHKVQTMLGISKPKKANSKTSAATTRIRHMYQKEVLRFVDR